MVPVFRPKWDRDFRRLLHIYKKKGGGKEKESYNAGFRAASRTQQASTLASQCILKISYCPAFQSKGLWSKKKKKRRRRTRFISFLAKVWQQKPDMEMLLSLVTITAHGTIFVHHWQNKLNTPAPSCQCRCHRMRTTRSSAAFQSTGILVFG